MLLIGPPGCGKSSLAVQLLLYGFNLVADDQVLLSRSDKGWVASCPEILQGKMHVRGKGFLDTGFIDRAIIACIFQSPLPAYDLSQPPALGVPVVSLDFFRPDAPAFVVHTLGNA